MQIASDKVSIGTTSSNAMLSVHGTSTATILQVYTTGGATTYTMDNVGEVSIGSDQTPENLLDIHSASAQAALAITSLGTDTDALIKFELADNTATFAMGVDDSDSDKFKISTTALGTNDRLTIDSSGNVGIGTNDPAGLSAFFAVRKDQDAATIQKIWNGTTGASAEARLDLVVATANAYVINTVKDNSGSPFYQIAYCELILQYAGL
jgi:hypothetical protein